MLFARPLMVVMWSGRIAPSSRSFFTAALARSVFSKRSQVPRGSVLARDVYSERTAENVSICDSIGCGNYIICLKFLE